MNTYWMWFTILAVIFLLYKVVSSKNPDDENEDCE